MSEYWVSQQKFHCKSKLLHESGKTHKTNVELFHKQKRDEKLHGARSEKELKQQLVEIERAAREALASDRLEASGAFHSNIQIPPGPPPPPMHFSQSQQNDNIMSNLSHASSNYGGKTAINLSDKTLDAISENLRENSSGSYTVRGVTYLEGQRHEDRLVSGVACEIFIEALDEWMPAVISACKEVCVPHTTLTMKYFCVIYHIESADSEQKEVTEEEVKSERLRLVLDTETHAVTDSGTVVTVVAKPQIVESTGLGAWTTVSVRVVTDDEEEEERVRLEEEARRQAEEARARTSRGEASQQLAEELASQETDSALTAFDPYNTGVYKGVKIGSELIETEIESLTGGAKVGFKKRSGGGGGGGGVRVFRRKIGDS